ncbi:MAG: Xaa-Pro peptidase family protein [Tepidisphaeraceae bacterium]
MIKGYVQRSARQQAVRLKKLRAEMKRHDLDGYLLTHPADLWHLTGFSGHDSVGYVDSTGITVITDGRYTTQLKLEAPKVKSFIRTGTLIDAVAEVMAGSKAFEVGFENGFTTVGFINGLHKALFDLRKLRKVARDIDLVPMHDLMLMLRKEKDSLELDQIGVAIDIAQQALTDTLPGIRIGQTEGEIAGQIILNMRRRGAMDASFQPIIAVGANAALPHYRAGVTTVAKNQPLLIDWGAIYDGYCSDLTRTFFVGKPNAKLERAYKVVLEAQMTAIEQIKPGMICKDADGIARKVIEKAGLGKLFGHGLGHGLGRDIHEEPRVHYLKDKDVLEPGHVVTIEPGVYLPGVGGIRIEDDILITRTGTKVLTSLDKSFDYARNAIGG